MARYFFNVYKSGRQIPDREGSECDGPDAARVEAIDTAKDLAHRAIESGIPSSTLCVEITVEGGGRVAALTVAEVLEHPDTPTFRKHCD